MKYFIDKYMLTISSQPSAWARVRLRNRWMINIACSIAETQEIILKKRSGILSLYIITESAKYPVYVGSKFKRRAKELIKKFNDFKQIQTDALQREFHNNSALKPEASTQEASTITLPEAESTAENLEAHVEIAEEKTASVDFAEYSTEPLVVLAETDSLKQLSEVEDLENTSAVEYVETAASDVPLEALTEIEDSQLAFESTFVIPEISSTEFEGPSIDEEPKSAAKEINLELAELKPLALESHDTNQGQDDEGSRDTQLSEQEIAATTEEEVPEATDLIPINQSNPDEPLRENVASSTLATNENRSEKRSFLDWLH